MPSRGPSPELRWRGVSLRDGRFRRGWPPGPADHWDPDVEPRWRESRAPAWVRVWLPVIISFLVQVPAVFVQVHTGRRLTFSSDTPLELVLHLSIALVGPVALIFARRFPGPVVVIVALAASADLLLADQTDGPPYIAFAFAIGSAIVRGARVWAWSAIAGSWILTLVLSGTLGISWQPWRVVGISLGILILVGVAEGIRTGADRRAQFRRALASRRQAEVQAERVRIARELHDVLAHSLSQINVQAGVGLHLLEKQPEKAAEALASIKSTSKTALDEVRSVLGILRAEGGADPSAPLVPEPDLSRLEGLAASVTSQGVDVTIGNRLRDVPGPTQLAMYRIVQESLTNVVRHAHATSATVDLDEDLREYRIAVVDNGTGVRDTAPREHPGNQSGGRGLLGMRERAELLGGSLEAGPRDSGGFAVIARIPRRASPAPTPPERDTP